MKALASFPIPTTLTDLERKPYRLRPYPEDFDDGNDEARAESFLALVDLLKEGNDELPRVDWEIDPLEQVMEQTDDDLNVREGLRSSSSSSWLTKKRAQALYTLVR
jgi:hypothetical protein